MKRGGQEWSRSLKQQSPIDISAIGLLILDVQKLQIIAESNANQGDRSVSCALTATFVYLGQVIVSVLF